MKATVIVDNIGNDELEGEWGLCIYIEYDEKKILLDAGASGLFVENAKKLGISLGDVDYAVLSHYHKDHADGIITVLKNMEVGELFLPDYLPNSD